METLIALSKASKKYQIYRSPKERLKEALHPLRKKYHQDFWALRDVSMEVKRGETLGILGQNGSGKTTLLQIICGILTPTSGEVRVTGRISSILALGAGFNPQLTGRENVYLNGAITGLSKEEITERLPGIESFASIGDFMDQPVKTYSSGMYVRLAFACAINVDPDVLVVDEALAVGDEVFQHRCMRRINEMRENGVTVCFVSHNTAAVKSLCTSAILIDYGRLLESGSPEDVANRYLALCNERKDGAQVSVVPARAGSNPSPQMTLKEKEDVVYGIPNMDHRYGNGKAAITGIRLYGPDGEERVSFKKGEEATIRVSFTVKEGIARPIAGVTVRDSRGLDIFATNTYMEGVPFQSVKKGSVYTFDFSFTVPDLFPHHYSVSPAVADGSMQEHVICDWIDNALLFHIEKTHHVVGLSRIPFSIECRRVEEGNPAGAAGR